MSSYLGHSVINTRNRNLFLKFSFYFALKLENLEVGPKCYNFSSSKKYINLHVSPSNHTCSTLLGSNFTTLKKQNRPLYFLIDLGLNTLVSKIVVMYFRTFTRGQGVVPYKVILKKK